MLLEAIRIGTAPAAIITSHLDPIIGLGCILGDELYASYPPMIVISERDRMQIASGDLIAVDERGVITVHSAGVSAGNPTLSPPEDRSTA